MKPQLMMMKATVKDQDECSISYPHSSLTETLTLPNQILDPLSNGI